MEVLNSLYRGYPGQDNLTPTAKAGIGVGNYRANRYLKVALHYLSIDANLGSVAGSADTGAIIKGIVIINREPGDSFLAQLLYKIEPAGGSMSPQRHDEPYSIIRDTGFS